MDLKNCLLEEIIIQFAASRQFAPLMHALVSMICLQFLLTCIWKSRLIVIQDWSSSFLSFWHQEITQLILLSRILIALVQQYLRAFLFEKSPSPFRISSRKKSTSMTRKKLANVYKSCPKMILPEK